ncbi:hypothetical protein ACFU96_45650 [Streptomyces sp. NPDC057620]|uniref:hypothetical protein n=1 Tax=Streptomyces sp. NPDC057620 TaxID=3346185 RepID=UPI0036BDDAD3
MFSKRRLGVAAATLAIAALAGPSALADTPPDTEQESPEAAAGQMTDAEPAAEPPSAPTEHAPAAPQRAALGLGALAGDTPPDTEEESPEPAPGQMTDVEPPEPGASSLMAGLYAWMWTDEPDPGGLVYFEPASGGGDAVSLHDKETDGNGVRITVWDETKDPDLHKFTFYNRLGKDKSVGSDASMGAPYDLAEGNCFKFRIQLVDGSNVIENSTDYAQWRNDNDADYVRNCDDVE